jgi:hypothetical protein
VDAFEVGAGKVRRARTVIALPPSIPPFRPALGDRDVFRVGRFR